MLKNRWYNFIVGGILIILITFVLNTISLSFITELLTNNYKVKYFIDLNTSFIPLGLAIFIVYKTYHKLGSIKINYRQILIGFLLWFTLNTLSLIVTFIINPGFLIFTFNLKQTLLFLLLSAILTPIQITTEELLFRGYLIDLLQSIKNNKIFIILISSVLFALPHLTNPEVKSKELLFFLSYIIMAILLSYLRLEYKGLEYSIGIHFANNFFTINILNYPNSPIPSSPIFILKENINPIESLINILIFSLLSVIIIHYIEKKRYIINT